MTGLTVGYPTLVLPDALGEVGRSFTATFRVRNWSDQPIIVSISGVQTEGSELLQRRVSLAVPARGEAPLDLPLRLPMSYPAGAHQAAVHLVFDDDPRIAPVDGTLEFTYNGSGGLPMPRLTFLYGLYIVLGAGALYLVVRLFLFLRGKLVETLLTGLSGGRARRGARRSVSSRAGGSDDHRRAKSPQARSTSGRGSAPDAHRHARSAAPRIRTAVARRSGFGPVPPLIEMRVQLQNHRIGFRNVHRIPPGAAKSVGGRSSSFSIYFVRVPGKIAEIRNANGRFVFTPLRREMFPRLRGPVRDCLGKPIPFVSSNGQEQLLYFQEWKAPLEEINGVLRQVRP